MTEIETIRDNCCSDKEGLAEVGLNKTMKTLPMFTPQKEEDVDVCCGPKPAPRSHPLEKPGYRIMPFVEDFISTANGPVPRVKTDLDFSDRMETILVRLGINRNNYKVSPGLYAIGRPDLNSVVLITANYKLSFDTLRKELRGLNAWLLVLDTRSVNVWCAAGKKNFSSEEVIHQAKRNNLEKIVSHRKLILPQLAATGVSALKVKKGCGFEVIWGPIRAKDIKPFLAAGFKAEKSMRQVTFKMSERLVLTPVEISQTLKVLIWLVPLIFLLSGFGPAVFSVSGLLHRGVPAALAVVLGVISGALLTPAFLPWIPFRAFSLKGALAGLIVGLGLSLLYLRPLVFMPTLALILLTGTLSSYLAMNFTGCTPFTSPSGVEKEMRKAIPIQSAAAGLGLILWFISAFISIAI
ncbi:MAG: mercury methylation corrinoid protein HgcA [Thermodesulfobacteriota bacterium]